MGTYINPKTETKEEYLAKHGTEITEEEFMSYTMNDETFAIALLSNPGFSAAWVADSRSELHEMKALALLSTDRRPKRYYSVPQDKVLAAV